MPTTTELLEKHKITVKSEFVPFSQSRNAKAKHRSLNWRVTLQCNGREIITTDYGAGLAHCPAYKNAKGSKTSLYNDERITIECEKGFEVVTESGLTDKKKPLLPNAADVVFPLLRDGEAIDYPTYEEWANIYGYDADSRTGEKVYRDCLEIGLKLRAGLGEKTLEDLRLGFNDY
jgi:hypothetical protein